MLIFFLIFSSFFSTSKTSLSLTLPSSITFIFSSDNAFSAVSFKILMLMLEALSGKLKLTELTLLASIKILLCHLTGLPTTTLGLNFSSLTLIINALETAIFSESFAVM
ncbi:hypothetical protein HYX00_05390 [Candidatus Woesearchaeota archaeon]|nr:hypothetical protein [Candidatus Woesearchaeota archaeon]